MSDGGTHTTRDFPELIQRLRLKAALAEAGTQQITAALHREAADAIEGLCAALSDDREQRWALRKRLDAALSESRPVDE